MYYPAGRRTLHNHAYLLQSFIQTQTLAYQFSRPAVAGMAAPAGDYQIAQSAQTDKGAGISAQGFTHPDDLGQGAGHQCGHGIIAVTQAISHTSGQSDDIFEGSPVPPRLHPDWCKPENWET